MSCFELYGINLAKQATLTASSTNELFPVDNIKDDRRTKVYRSTSNSSSVIFDLNETSDIDTIMLLADKRNGFGFNSATVEFNATSNFTSPAFSVVMDLSEVHSIALAEFTKISYRFCRVVMSSTLGYCELAKVYIGSKTVLSKGIKFGWTLKEENLSNKTTNRYGQLFIDLISTQKKINFSFSYLNKDDLAIINAILDESSEVSPLWIKIGETTMSDDFRRTSGAYTLTDIPTITNTHFNKYALSMSLSELS